MKLVLKLMLNFFYIHIIILYIMNNNFYSFHNLFYSIEDIFYTIFKPICKEIHDLNVCLTRAPF